MTKSIWNSPDHRINMESPIIQCNESVRCWIFFFCFVNIVKMWSIAVYLLLGRCLCVCVFWRNVATAKKCSEKRPSLIFNVYLCSFLVSPLSLFSSSLPVFPFLYLSLILFSIFWSNFWFLFWLSFCCCCLIWFPFLLFEKRALSSRSPDRTKKEYKLTYKYNLKQHRNKENEMEWVKKKIEVKC